MRTSSEEKREPHVELVQMTTNAVSEMATACWEDDAGFVLRSNLVPKGAIMASEKMRLLAEDPSAEREPACSADDAPLIAEGVLVNILACVRAAPFDAGPYLRSRTSFLESVPVNDSGPCRVTHCG